MRIKNKHYRTIWFDRESATVKIIDQRLLPFQLKIATLNQSEDFIFAIKEMLVRGAPLIGATAGFGMYFATLEAEKAEDAEKYINQVAAKLVNTRPTAVDLQWAINKQLKKIKNTDLIEEQQKIAFETAEKIVEESVLKTKKIGEHGFELIKKISDKKKGEVVNILTHCNAGWLACIDYGTATAPIYEAARRGIKIHVWVDETRPRNQGARLTAFELGEEGINHTVIPDNTGGHLMQHNLVDMVIVGSDRATKNGDVVNKIGTYLKALAAKDNNIPFYVALPNSTFDYTIQDALKEIPIEQRNAEEVSHVEGWNGEKITKIRIIPENSPIANYGFDLTPARLITNLITEDGII